jgi:hypothetical protein
MTQDIESVYMDVCFPMWPRRSPCMYQTTFQPRPREDPHKNTVCVRRSNQELGTSLPPKSLLCHTKQRICIRLLRCRRYNPKIDDWKEPHSLGPMICIPATPEQAISSAGFAETCSDGSVRAVIRFHSYPVRFRDDEHCWRSCDYRI